MQFTQDTQFDLMRLCLLEDYLSKHTFSKSQESVLLFVSKHTRQDLQQEISRAVQKATDALQLFVLLFLVQKLSKGINHSINKHKLLQKAKLSLFRHTGVFMLGDSQSYNFIFSGFVSDSTSHSIE